MWEANVRYAFRASSSACFKLVMSSMTPAKYGSPFGVRRGKSCTLTHRSRPDCGPTNPNSDDQGVWFVTDSAIEVYKASGSTPTIGMVRSRIIVAISSAVASRNSSAWSDRNSNRNPPSGDGHDR
jgi:hypothetical protein